MSKTKKETKPTPGLPDSPSKYSYKGDELVTIPANIFMLMWNGLESALQKSIHRHFIAVPEWVSTITGKPIATPTREEVAQGLAKQTTSFEKTFDVKNSANFQESFEDWVYPYVISAHMTNIEKGIAKPIEELQKAAAEERAKANAPKDQGGDQIADMAVVAEEVKPTAKKRAPRKIKK